MTATVTGSALGDVVAGAFMSTVVRGTSVVGGASVVGVVSSGVTQSSMEASEMATSRMGNARPPSPQRACVVASRLEAPDACAAGSEDHVALVIDFGTVTAVPDAPRGMIIECVAVAPGATGLDVLRSHAASTGLGLRMGRSGLVCGIDAYPAATEGCATRVGDHYLYWSYWRGEASGWTYQNIGPGDHRVSSTRVEGWRFVDAGLPGVGDGLAPPRNIAGRSSPATGASNIASNICVPAAPVAPPPPGQTPSRPSAPGPQVPAPSMVTPPDGAVAVPGTSTTTVAKEGNDAVTTTTTASSTKPTSTLATVRGTAPDAAPLLSATQVRNAASGKDDDSPVLPVIGAVVAALAIGILVVLGVRRSRGAGRA